MIIKYKENEGLSGVGYPTGDDMHGLQQVVNVMFDELNQLYDKEKNYHYTFVCRGSSGAILAGCVALMFKNQGYRCSIVHIKKPGENSHQEYLAFGSDNRLIMIDDFITTGKTVNAIHNALIETDKPFDIDTLIVGGTVSVLQLDFKPKHIFCKSIEIPSYIKHKYTKL